MKQRLLWVLALAVLATACKKDDETGPSAATTQLTGKRWGLTVASSQQGAVLVDLYARLQPCEKDNYVRFNTDHSAEANEGPLKCDAADAQAQPGSWELLSNDTKLMLTTPLLGTGTAALLDIVSISDSRLQLRGIFIDPDTGVSTTYNATLTPY